jgi:ribose transport system substrate-binding protein
MMGSLVRPGACAAAILVVSTLAAAAEDPVKVTIGWTPPDITGAFSTATDFFERSAEEANKNGFDVAIVSRSPATDPAFADQAAIIEDFIKNDVDVIAVSPVEAEAITPALRAATAAGIPIIIVDLIEPIPGVTVASYIGLDSVDAAKVTAYALLDYFGGPGVLGSGRTVELPADQYLDLAFWEELYRDISAEEKAAIAARGAIIADVAGGLLSATRLDGFNAVVGGFPGVEIVGDPCPAEADRDKGRRCAEEFLRAHPGLDFILAMSSEAGLGAMLAAEAAKRLETSEAGPTVGNETVAVFSNEGTPESADHVAEGRIIAETAHGYAEWGWLGTAFAIQLACGLTPTATFDIRPRIAYQANARLFYPNPVLPVIDWQDIRARCKKAG